MPSAGIAIAFACFVWWFSTGAILVLVRLPRAWHAAALAGFGMVALLAVWGLVATRGTAHAMYLDDKIGSIAPGMEADLVVLDMKSTPVIDYRMRFAENFEEALFIQMMLGDDRAVQATYVAGRLLYGRERGYAAV